MLKNEIASPWMRESKNGNVVQSLHLLSLVVLVHLEHAWESNIPTKSLTRKCTFYFPYTFKISSATSKGNKTVKLFDDALLILSYICITLSKNKKHKLGHKIPKVGDPRKGRKQRQIPGRPKSKKDWEPHTKVKELKSTKTLLNSKLKILVKLMRKLRRRVTKSVYRP